MISRCVQRGHPIYTVGVFDFGLHHANDLGSDTYNSIRSKPTEVKFEYLSAASRSAAVVVSGGRTKKT